MTRGECRSAAPLLTSGQLSTALIGLVSAVVLIVTTVPAVLDSRDGAARDEPAGVHEPAGDPAYLDDVS